MLIASADPVKKQSPSQTLGNPDNHVIPEETFCRAPRREGATNARKATAAPR